MPRIKIQDAYLGCRVSKRTAQKFKAQARRSGVHPSAAMRALIEGYAHNRPTAH